MIIQDIINSVDVIAPAGYAESWDRVGLQIGNAEAETTGCLLALDVTTDTIREARRTGVSLVIAHHPVIFEPLVAVTEHRAPGNVILAAARVNVSVYVAHTNLDASPTHGTSVALAEALGLSRGTVLQPVEGYGAIDGEPFNPGLGMITEVPQMTLAGLAQYIAGRLGKRRLGCVGDTGLMVQRVALMPGAGGSCIEQAATMCDVLITGELKYHEAQKAKELGLSVLTAGHYETERPVLNLLARYLRDIMHDEIKVAITQDTPNFFEEWLPENSI